MMAGAKYIYIVPVKQLQLQQQQKKKKIVKYSSHSQPKRNISSLYFSLASSKVGFDLLTWIFCACVNAHFTPPQMSVLWSHKQY